MNQPRYIVDPCLWCPESKPHVFYEYISESAFIVLAVCESCNHWMRPGRAVDSAATDETTRYSDVPAEAFTTDNAEFIDELRLNAVQKDRLQEYSLRRMGFATWDEYSESDVSLCDHLNVVMSYFLSIAVRDFLDSEYGL